MDYYEMKKSGQIPAFGNWEYVNDLPITEYFECARQAGLIPPTSFDSSDSLCQCPPCVKARHGGCAVDVYGNAAVAVKAEVRKAPPPRVVGIPPKKQQASKVSSGNNNRSKSNNRPPQVKEEKKQVLRKANNDAKEQNSRTQKQKEKQRRVINVVKPVDEDLYKIPSHLLHNSKRKKMLGFISRCLAPPCRA